ncbi:MAG: site-specific DNA-methyltransferase, partial [Pseudomonadota bacterium]|nr:site-specific DNA-methyltransferase [Pseudomonadota bacterium]
MIGAIDGDVKAEFEACGSGFRYCELGPKIFDERGHIDPEIRFADLARHIWFAETKTPLYTEMTGTVIGTRSGKAYALLFNGILDDRSIDGGNVLTTKSLAIIRQDLAKAHPGFEGEIVVYAA